MAYVRAQPPPLTPELLEAALAGMSVRRLSALYGLSRADSQGLARWAGPLLDALSEAPGAERGGSPAPATAEIVLKRTPTDAGHWPSAPPQKESRSAAPADDEEKTKSESPTPPTSDVVVPSEFSTPELRAIYLEAYARAGGTP